MYPGSSSDIAQMGPQLEPNRPLVFSMTIREDLFWGLIEWLRLGGAVPLG